MVLFVITLVSAVFDSIGISMMLPLLNSSAFGDKSMDASQQGTESSTLMQVFSVFDDFNEIVAVIACVFIIKGLIKYIEGHWGARLIGNLFTQWRWRLYEAYKRLPYLYFIKQNSGHFTNVINNQVNTSSLFVSVFVKFSSSAVTALVYLIFAAFLNPTITLVAVVFGIVVMLVLRPVFTKTKAVARAFAVENSVLNKFIIQIMQSYKYLKSSNGFSAIDFQFNDSIHDLKRMRIKSGTYSAILAAIQEPLAIFFMLGLIVWYVQVEGNNLAPVLVTLLLFYRSMNTLMLAQGFWHAVLNQSGSFEVLIEEFDAIDQEVETDQGERFQGFEQYLKADSVSLRIGETQILDCVSIEIKKNQTIALVGASGSGKTTLIDVLTRLIPPSEGRLLIDGRDAQDYSRSSWQERIGYVSQDSIIYDDTIANNITLWGGDFDADQNLRDGVCHAAKLAHCLDFIHNKPGGFHAQIGERGVLLSGGQRQRIAIARELFKQPDLLILDEATSALDSESEREIKNSIEAMKGSVTIVVIAHRLSTVRQADKIYVLEGGKILDAGDYETLITTSDQFRNLVQLQSLD